jgi:hypothetical protein
VSDNRVLRRIFEPKGRKLWGARENCIMRNFMACMMLWYTRCYLGNQIKVVRWAGHMACMGEMRNAYRILVGTPEGKRPLRSPRCRWED